MQILKRCEAVSLGQSRERYFALSTLREPWWVEGPNDALPSPTRAFFFSPADRVCRSPCQTINYDAQAMGTAKTILTIKGTMVPMVLKSPAFW